MASTRRTAFLTDDFVRGLKAPTDKTQEIFWDAPDSAIAGSAGIFVPGLGLRCTAGGVKAFVYNQQVTDSVTQEFLDHARAAGVPVVGVYETMPTPGYDYQSWMMAELQALRQAVATGKSTTKL